jgi:transcription initiation factor TFIIIB Brf1 subunit/transcription initiation factor TFIIB
MKALCPACDQPGFEYDTAKEKVYCTKCLFLIDARDVRAQKDILQAQHYILSQAFEFNLREFKDA